MQSFLAAEKNQVPNYDYQQKLENETLENLYSPSYWSKRLSQDVSLSRNNILFGGGGVFLPPPEEIVFSSPPGATDA